MISPEKIVENAAVNLVCESCGGEFSCGANAGECWCFAVKLETETLTDLREKYTGCLCGECLAEIKSPDFSE